MLIAFGICIASTFAQAGEVKPADTIVFVCEHGSVKSLIAMQWFNRLAAQGGLHYRAVSRGITPDQAVPKGIVDNLAKDGFAVEDFKPKRLAKPDFANAKRVVSIGVEVADQAAGTKVQVDGWTDIPPASENYTASRDAIRRRIQSLLVELKSESRPGLLKQPRRPRS